MNNSTFNTEVTQSLQFLSVLSYMNMLSDIFYLKNLLHKEEQHQSFPIINTLYKYLNEGNSETKIKLVQQMLNMSHLSHFGENEKYSLNENYVDKTLEYIVTNVVFSQYGNIHGYLAKVVSTTKTLDLIHFKNEIYRQLNNISDQNKNGTISYLNPLTKLKIVENLLWPLFPRTKKKRNIIDIDYIYAQAGLSLARAANLNTNRIRFKKLVHISLPLEAMVLNNTIDESILQIFSIPALLYYTHKTKKIDENISLWIRDERTWFEAFRMLFEYLTKTFRQINQKLENNNLYQFQFAMSNYRTRTELAREILNENCHYNKSMLQSALGLYKTFPSSTICGKMRNKLKDLNEAYSQQIEEIRNKYLLLAKDFMQEAFDTANLTSLINSTNTSVIRGQVKPIIISCFPVPCIPFQPTVNKNVTLIMIKHNDKEDLYAIVLNTNNVTLMNYNEDREIFTKKLGLPNGTEFETNLFYTFLKHPSESIETLKDRIAEEKGKMFAKQLYTLGYEETTAERIFDFLLLLVPFYHCVKYSSDAQYLEATLACFSDAISFLPIAGQVSKILFRLSDITIHYLLKLSGTMLRTISLKSLFPLTMNLGLELSTVFSKELLKRLSLQVVQFLDPGFQLSYMIVRTGTTALRKIITTLSRTITRYPLFRTELKITRRMWTKILTDKKKPKDLISVVVDQKEGHDVFQYITNGKYAEKYIRLENGNAVMKKMIGFENEVPVITSRVSLGKVYYRRINLQTELPEGIEWTLKNNVLHPVKLPFRQHITKIVNEGLSGHPKIKSERVSQMNKAIRIMTTKGTTVHLARNIIQQYMLSVRNVPIQMGHINLNTIKPINIKTFPIDPNNPDSLRKYLGNDYQTQKEDIDKYLVRTPTYEDFARDWVNSKQVSVIYKDWLLPNDQEIAKLLYLPRQDLIRIDVNNAMKKINSFHGMEIQEKRILDIVQEFNKHELSRYATFEDYYAILIWKENAYSINNLKNIVQLKMELAINKLVVSLADDDFLQKSGTLFWVEMRDPLTIEREMQQLNGGVLTTTRYVYTTTIENVAHEYLNVERFIITNGAKRKKVPVIYKINLDNKYLVSNVYTILPTDQKFPVVLLPEMEFNIHYIEKKNFNNQEVFCVTMQNAPITKEVVLLKIAKKIEKLRNKIFHLVN